MKPHLSSKQLERRSQDSAPNVATQVVTTGWLLTTLTTLLCTLAAVLVRWIWAEDPNQPAMRLLMGMMRLASLITSVGGVGLMLLAGRIQREPLPRELVAATWAIVALPWSALIWRLMS